jgi:hypothetical protein
MEMAFVIFDPRKPRTFTILPEHAKEAGADSTPLTWNCIDCGVNTHPGAKGRKGLLADLAARAKSRTRFDDRTEVYIVRPAVWKRARVAPFGGCLCIGCLEKRLGRKLKDFNWHHEFNYMPGTKRLLQRRGHW